MYLPSNEIFFFHTTPLRTIQRTDARQDLKRGVSATASSFAALVYTVADIA